MSRPTLFLLHGLGLSAHFWDRSRAALGDAFDCVSLDLPGFGDAAGMGALTVEQMVDWLIGRIRVQSPDLWMLVGHSMGGKLATLAASRAESGEVGLAGLAGIVLLAASPPAPEPMSEQQRDEMRGWFAQGAIRPEDAHRFVKANIDHNLPDDLMEQTVGSVCRSNRAAWLAWLERGSLEDWSAAVGTLETPALIVAGAQDGELGADAQRRLNRPYYSDARVEVVADAAHFLPLEQPDVVAALIAGQWRRVADRPRLPLRTDALIRSDRTSARTRQILLERVKAPAAPTLLDPGQISTLAAMVARILPACGEPVDLAFRIDATLSSGSGDGWRFAELPADTDAWRRGLDTLDALAGDFAGLTANEQDDWLQRMANGTCGKGAGEASLTPAQMKLWFEDVCAELVRTWLSHPLTMARIGYDGFANGGDGSRKQGYTRLAADDLEEWQSARSHGAGQ